MKRLFAALCSAMLGALLTGALCSCTPEPTPDCLLFAYDKIDNGYIVTADDGAALPAEVVIPEEHEGLPVISIYDQAFSGSETLERVYLPDSVTAIGYRAFADCPNLKEIRLGKSVEQISSYAFSGCPSLTGLTVAAGNETYHASNGCLIITQIGQAVFAPSLESLPTDGQVTALGSYLFYGDDSLEQAVIPDGITSIGAAAFSDCKNLRSVTLPASVEHINEYAFYGCSALENISVGNGIVSLAANAFDGTDYAADPENWDNGALYLGNALYAINEDLPQQFTMRQGISVLPYLSVPGWTHLNGSDYFVDVTLPDTLTELGEGAFSSCPNLVRIDTGDGVRTISDGAFSDCPKLISVTLGHSVSHIEGSAFDNSPVLEIYDLSGGFVTEGMYRDHAMVIHYSALEPSRLTIRDGLVFLQTDDALVLGAYIGDAQEIALPDMDVSYTIGKRAFFRNRTVRSVTIPACVTEIGEEAFRSSALRSLALPAGPCVVAAYAFADTPLKTVTIPAAITRIEGYAFRGCDELQEVRFENPDGWRCNGNLPSFDLSDPAEAAECVKSFEYARWTYLPADA